MSADLKAAAWGAIRLMIRRGWLLLPAGATGLLRELTLLPVEVLPRGGERIETGRS